MKKLNPNEAPPGYVAVETAPSAHCTGCALATPSQCDSSRAGSSCVSISREDGRNVIFIKREPAPAEPAQLDTRYTLRLPASVKAKAQRIGAAAVIAAIEAAQE